MDLTHLTFVHASTIGNYALIDQADMKTVRGENDVQANRWMISSDPPPTYAKAVDFKGQKVDRWQLLRYTAPSIVRLLTSSLRSSRTGRCSSSSRSAPTRSPMRRASASAATLAACIRSTC